ncbi:MAG: 30S ribosomal protein S12 methylthiotransferase RimO [Eubacterium sp.]|nr:30S ribosomal protein S12 methylthiotransferase RimO [Eubacterium sp.]
MYKVLMISLGCDKNRVDSEEMIALLSQRGYIIINEEEEADIAVVNTCCFIGDALMESIDTVLEIAGLKKTGKLKYLVVAGCMSERFKNDVVSELPEVDAFIGTSAIDHIADLLDRVTAGEKGILVYEPLTRLPIIEEERLLTETPYMAYLKIAEGCDKRCTYCAIPYFRGPFRSVPMNLLIKRAAKLAENGVKELILVAQETTCYGTDLYGKKTLHELIRKLSEIEGIEWIRLMYCYPEEIYDELIDEIAENPKVLHYIDMPLQHTEDEMLRRMGRRLNRAELISIVEKLRGRVPDIAIRTTLITGFPGETAEMHEGLMDTIDNLAFDRLGVFTYSREEGTPAADFPDQVDEDVKERYRDDIMALQQEISFDINNAFIGTVLNVIIEGYIPEDDIYVGRSYRDAPDVDGMVFVSTERNIISGEIVRVRIDEAGPYDMKGTEMEG